MNTYRSLLLCSALAGSLAACGDSTTPSQDAGTGDTGGSDARAGDAGNAYRVEGTMPACVARTMNNAMTPSYRITQLGITAPAALAPPTPGGTSVVGNIINGAIAEGDFLWGISFDLTAMTIRTGALDVSNITRGMVGLGLLDGSFRFYAGNAPSMGGAGARWDPVSGPVSVMGNNVTVGMAIPMVLTVPVFNPPMGAMPRSVLTELPLQNARMRDVRLSMDRGCIGRASFRRGFFLETGNNEWETINPADMRPYGVIEADITIAAARMVRIPALNTTLCSLLANANCDTTPQAMWPNQPDALGMTAYHLTANFTAVAATIAR